MTSEVVFPNALGICVYFGGAGKAFRRVPFDGDCRQPEVCSSRPKLKVALCVD